MKRCGQTFTVQHRDFFYWLYEQTAEQRRRTLRESEMKWLQRSF